MASTLKHLRSSTADKRPTGSGLSDGQIAINTASGTPGLFVKDNAGDIVKIGPAHVGTAAPNAVPAGSTGNSKGEMWVDENLTTRGLKYYDGTNFVNLTPSGTSTTIGLVQLATNAETQAGTVSTKAVTPSGLQSKVSDSISTTSSTVLASATAVKTAYDLANAALPKSGGTVSGVLEIGSTGTFQFDGSSADANKTVLAVVNPTANRTITLPNVTGTVVTTGDNGTVTSTMIADGTIANVDINASAAIVDTKLATISTAGKVSNSATTATNANTASAIVARDGSGNFSAGTISATFIGNLTGTASAIADNTVTSAKIVDGTIVNADVNASAAIADTKLATISTAGKVSNSATTATSSNTANAIVTRDASGNFTAGTITANLSGNVTGNLTGTASAIADNTVTSAKIVDGTIVNADVNASAAIAGTKISPDFGSQNVVTTGTATAASLIPTGSSVPTNGVYLPAANSVAISTDGSSRLHIASDGKIGVGIVPTVGKVETRVGNFTANLAADGYFLTSVNSTLAAGSAVIGGLTMESDGSGVFSVSLVSANSTTAGAQTYQKAVEAVGTATSQRLQFYSGGSEKMRLDSAGRVGIGTTSPGAKLHVMESTASAAAASGASVAQFERAGNAGITVSTADSGQATLFFGDTASSTIGRVQYEHSADALAFWANSSERARIDSSGRLLVGTSTARSNFNNTTLSANFQIEGDNFARSTLSSIRNSNDDSGGALIIGKSRGATVGSNTIVADNDTLGTIFFQGNDGSEFVIGARIQAQVDGTPGADDMPGRLVFSTTADGASSPTERMRIDSGGAVIIAGTSVPSNESFYVNNKVSGFNRDSNGLTIRFYRSSLQVGDISVTTTATAYNTSSDYRLKENVVPLTGAIDRLQQLPVHRFNFIVDPDTVVDGFIAHEAQEVVPECVTGTKDAVDADGNPVMQGIDQSKLVPLLTAALQEALAKIETLEARLDAAGIS